MRYDVLGFAKLDGEMRVRRKGFFRVVKGDEEFVPLSNKDSAFVRPLGGSRYAMLTRPEVKGARICWRCVADVGEFSIDADSLEPVLAFEEWELKVGWSTNAVQLSSNEYLVGWHGVLKGDLSYREGFALVDGDGELLAVTDYLL